MHRISVFALLILSIAIRAQPLPDREELRKIPLSDALVLDPAVGWPHRLLLSSDATQIAAIELGEGRMRAIVAEPGKFQQWHRTLTVPVDPRRYPFAVIAYRASGLAPSDEGLVEIHSRGFHPVLRNREAIDDGEIHEVVVDLAELGIEEEIGYLYIRPCCEGPEPAVFDLLGLRFESDGKLPPANHEPAPEFSLQVVGADNQPLAGAKVTIDAEVLNAARSAVTGADGKVTLQPTRPGGRHMLRVTKEGMAPVEIVPKEGEDLPAKVTLRRGTRYGGIVRNEDGQPVPFVAVSLVGHSWSVEMLTDEGGRWLSPVLPDGGKPYGPRLSHPDYQSGLVSPNSLQALRQGKAEMVILRGVTLHGTVLSPDGRPVPDADVRCRAGSRGILSAKTDADGGFSFSALPRGRRIWVLAEHPEFGPSSVGVDPADRTAEVTIRLQSPAKLSGRVIDPKGKPVAWARLRVAQWGRSCVPSWHATTDRKGRFTWDNAPPGKVLVHVERGRYMALNLYPIQASAEEVTIVLPRVLRISGAVTDAATKRSVAGCRVLYGTVPEGWTPAVPVPPQWAREDVKTDRRGRFEVALRQAEFEQEVVLKVEKEGYDPVLSRRFRLDEGKQKLDIALQSGKSIEGIVLFTDGRPAPETMVYLATAGSDLTIGPGLRVGYTKAESAQTDAAGQFRFPATQGQWRMAAFRAEGYAEIDNGSFVAPAKLVLRPWANVAGIYLHDGRPLVECPIEVRPHPPHYDRTRARIGCVLSATTNEQGAFSVSGISPGLAAICSAPPGSETAFGAPSRRDVILLDPGQTAQVVIGAASRHVGGRFALAEGLDGTVFWSILSGSIEPCLDVRERQPEMPEGFWTMSSKERMAWHGSAEGQAYRRAWERHREAANEAAARAGLPFCRFKTTKEGTFRIPDLPPGKYVMRMRTRLGRNGMVKWENPILVGVTHEFTVPGVPDGRTGKPLDLGTLELRVEK